MTPHACNAPLSCPCCCKRFWQWAESHTRGRVPRSTRPAPSFYEAAAKFIDVDHRARRAHAEG